MRTKLPRFEVDVYSTPNTIIMDNKRKIKRFGKMFNGGIMP